MVHLNTAVAVIKDANANAPAICKYLEAIYVYAQNRKRRAASLRKEIPFHHCSPMVSKYASLLIGR